MNWLISSTLIIIPFLLVAIEAVISIRNTSYRYLFSNKKHEDYQILVPIWGNIIFLENVKYLSKYGSKVMLCTSGNESKEFYMNLDALVQKYDFKLFKDKTNFKVGEKVGSNQRAISGSIRDTIIRNALNTVMKPFVVTLDADSTATIDISYLVGELKQRELDIASIRIVPSNSNVSALTKLQTFEYYVAMNLRFLCPWLISGACQAAKTDVLKNIMNRHSLFFQGNDVEIGLLAQVLGYKVGHIPFIISTSVPDNFKSWFRQRLAWGGGEFRLFLINFKFILKHPLFWIYGAVITICMFPLRWIAFSSLSSNIYIILGLYVGLILYLHWEKRNWWLILMPIYMLFNSLIITPLGIIWYFYMAYKDKNYGIINNKKDI
jgi:cellulose synthase/poly-beta-1,6-N-acetylglucosamine synthase-like glycosyltransferase